MARDASEARSPIVGAHVVALIPSKKTTHTPKHCVIIYHLTSHLHSRQIGGDYTDHLLLYEKRPGSQSHLASFSHTGTIDQDVLFAP
jgi:hypothetical protein